MDAQQDFGSYLRGERQLRRVGLCEVAETTKIPLSSLELLELGRWGDLPAEVFLRGFVVSYGRCLGIGDEAGERFDQARILTQRREDARSEPVGEAATAVGTRQRFGLALFVIILLILVTITFSMLWGVGPHASSHASLQTGNAVELVKPAVPLQCAVAPEPVTPAPQLSARRSLV